MPCHRRGQRGSARGHGSADSAMPRAPDAPFTPRQAMSSHPQPGVERATLSQRSPCTSVLSGASHRGTATCSRHHPTSDAERVPCPGGSLVCRLHERPRQMCPPGFRESYPGSLPIQVSDSPFPTVRAHYEAGLQEKSVPQERGRLCSDLRRLGSTTSRAFPVPAAG